MTTHEDLFAGVSQILEDRIEGFDILYKDENFWSKVRGVLAYPFNRNYMTRYTTTLYPDVLFPSRVYVEENPSRAWKILAHEAVHLWDRLKEGPWFNVRYALPPAFSPGRRDIELRGYGMSMAANYWRYGSIRQSTKDWIVDQFTGSSYFFMWPFPGDVYKRLNQIEEDIKTGAILTWPNHEMFVAVHGLLKR